jgi:hypothetical protein
LTDQRYERQSGFGIEVTVEFVTLEHLFQLSEGGPKRKFRRCRAL